jgi:DNA-binding transcriptional MerR regulator
MDQFTISDIETLSGIKAHTIRMWEQRYGFLKPGRTSSNIRYYSCHEVKKLLNIALLNRCGYKISKLQNIPPDELKQMIEQQNNSNLKQEKIIYDLLRHMIDFNIIKFEETLNRCIQEMGEDRMVVDILLPFLERTGICGLRCHLGTAQQSLAGSVIRRKVMAALDRLHPQINRSSSILLFSPENDHDENHLLLILYLLLKNGFRVTYLGPDVPVADAQCVAALKKSDFLFIYSSCTENKAGLMKMARQFLHHLPGSEIILTGQGFFRVSGNSAQHIRVLPSISDLQNFISTL